MKGSIKFDENGRLIRKTSQKKEISKLRDKNKKSLNKNHGILFRDKKSIKKVFKKFNSHFNEINMIDMLDFFMENQFIGKTKGIRNFYYVYNYDKFYVIMTNLRPKVNYNIFLTNEIDEIYKFCKSNFSKWFTMKNLLKKIASYNATESRIDFFIKNTNENDLIEEEEKVNYLYLLLLNSMYILVTKELLCIKQVGRKLEFIVKKGKKVKSTDMLNDVKILDCQEDILILQNCQFYFTLKPKDMRGTMFTFIKEEILMLSRHINHYSIGERIYIANIIQGLDYTKRFNEIYNITKDLNIRQKRDPIKYFDYRIKAALRIIKFQKNNIRIWKEERKTFYEKC